jgi:hypothetical protein
MDFRTVKFYKETTKHQNFLACGALAWKNYHYHIDLLEKRRPKGGENFQEQKIVPTPKTLSPAEGRDFVCKKGLQNLIFLDI